MLPSSSQSSAEIEDLYPSMRKRVLEAHSQLEDLHMHGANGDGEDGKGHGTASSSETQSLHPFTQFDSSVSAHSVPIELQAALSTTINTLSRDIVPLQDAASRSPAGKRDVWIRKVGQLAEEIADLRSDLDSLMHHHHRAQREKEEREALLSRRTARLGGQADTMVPLEGLMMERRSIAQSNRNIDETASIGQTILDMLGTQRATLNKAQRGVFQVASTLGLSQSLLRLIQRRQFGDRLIMWTCMLGILLIIWLFWWFIW